MSTSPRLLTLFAALSTMSVRSAFNQTLCYGAGQVNDATLTEEFTGYLEGVVSDLDENTECLPTELADVNNNLHDCFVCSFDFATLTEQSRYQNLVDLNDNIDVTIAAFETVRGEGELAYITYVAADYATADSRCDGMPYPRICRYSLRDVARSGPAAFGIDFFFTMAFDTANSDIQFELSFSTFEDGEDRWFGIGFGEVGMQGDSVLYTCGQFECATATPTDYYLALDSTGGRSIAGVIPDVARSPAGTEDYTNFSSSNIDGEFAASFERAFVTGDAWDQTFFGNETSLFVYAAAGSPSGSSGTILENHPSQLVVTPVEILVVPAPEASDTVWCVDAVVNDCVIPVSPVETGDPTAQPSPLPSALPSYFPTQMPVSDTESAAPPTLHLSANVSILVMCILFCNLNMSF